MKSFLLAEIKFSTRRQKHNELQIHLWRKEMTSTSVSVCVCVCVCVCVFPHLGEDEGLWVAAVQAEDEADGLEEFLDAGAELLLLHPAGGPRVKDPRLDDELEEILQSLQTHTHTHTHTQRNVQRRKSRR